MPILQSPAACVAGSVTANIRAGRNSSRGLAGVAGRFVDIDRSSFSDVSVLSDLGNTVAKQYGLVFRLADEHVQALKERGQDLTAINGEDGANELPIPATFVINTAGVVEVTCVDPDHTYRVDPDIIIRYLESL